MTSKLYLQAAFILATLVSNAGVYAQEAAPSSAPLAAEIQLKNGTSIHGSLVSIEPGQRVVMLVDGEQRTIAWDDVAKIVGGPTEAPPSTTPPPPAAPTTTTPPPATTPTKGMPFIHVETDWPEVELHRVDGEIGAGIYSSKNQIGPQTLSKYICEAPCDKLVDGREGHRFFFAGQGMYPSQQFRLEQRDGYLTARVHGVSVARLIGGVMLTAIGGSFTLSGAMLFGVSFASVKATPQQPNPAEEAHTMRTAGAVVGSIGLGMAIGGIYLLASGKTQVELIKTNRGETALSLSGGVFRF